MVDERHYVAQRSPDCHGVQESVHKIYTSMLHKFAKYRTTASVRALLARDVLGNAIWQASTKPGGRNVTAGKKGLGSTDKKGGSSEGGGGGGGGGSSPSWNDVVQAALMLALLLAFSNFSSGSSPGAGLETIDFQTFRNNILARDLVDKASTGHAPTVVYVVRAAGV